MTSQLFNPLWGSHAHSLLLTSAVGQQVCRKSLEAGGGFVSFSLEKFAQVREVKSFRLHFCLPALLLGIVAVSGI